MKNINVFILLTGVLLLLTLSCAEEEDSKTGQLLISSKFDFIHASVSGYDFSSGEYLPYPGGGEQPDIILDQFRLLDGSLKPGFTSPGNQHGFALIQEFNNMQASLDFFNNDFTSADTTIQFSTSSDTVKLYQVFLLRTSNDTYVKLHIRSIQMTDDMAGPYLDVLLDYYYQDNGTADFPL
ncbi:MAG: hypothetical protein K9J30_08095 [Bacteroidales bacterium]|nr:hypothetical protein [Bacteroidales bacterium]